MEPFYILFMAIVHVFFMWPVIYWWQFLLVIWILLFAINYYPISKVHKPEMSTGLEESVKSQTTDWVSRVNELYRVPDLPPGIVSRNRWKICIAITMTVYFFAYVMPSWLPKGLDPYQSEMKDSLYVTPAGIFNDRGRFLYHQYGCDFLVAQLSMVKLRSIGEDDFHKKNYLSQTERKLIEGVETYRCNLEHAEQ
jgi:hypothetical protein